MPGEQYQHAHLIFRRGDQAVSVFSIPGRAVYWPKDGSRYRLEIEQHQIAGFVNGSNMYCMVGTSPKQDLSLAQMQAISDDLEQRMRDGQTAMGSCSSGQPLAIAGR